MDVGQIFTLFDAGFGADVARQAVGEGAAQSIVFAAKNLILWALLPAHTKRQPRRRGQNWRMKLGTLLASLLTSGNIPKAKSARILLAGRARNKPKAAKVTTGYRGKGVGRRVR